MNRTLERQMLTCQEVNAFIDTYVDGEFEAQEHAEIELHLLHCEDCKRVVAFRFQVKQLVAMAHEPAPKSLHDRIFATLDFEDAASQASLSSGVQRVRGKYASQTNATEPNIFDQESGYREQGDYEKGEEGIARSNDDELKSPTIRRFGANQRPTSMARQFAFGLAAVVAIGLVFLLGQHFTVAPATTHNLSVWEESVDWYRADFPMEVKGPNSKEVSDWFKGKVNFKVQPLSFGPGLNAKKSDVELVGARLASMRNRRAALLEYRVDDADVTMLIFDGKGISIPSENLQSIGGQQIGIVDGPGYDVALFQKDGLTYTITTDLPSAKFETLIKNVLSSN